MERVTKKELAKLLRYNKNGLLHKTSERHLRELLKFLKPEEKFYYQEWNGKHLNQKINTWLLMNFCKPKFGNDKNGGANSDYLIIYKSEYKKLKKRILWFIEEEKEE
jgi:hypothetical protein